MNRLNILISAFFCHPKRGSESSVGWNFVKKMAEINNVYVLTKESNKEAIEQEIQINPIDNLQFFYYDIAPKALFNEKTMTEQLHYLVWQIKVFRSYKRISKNISLDLVHHLTFNQYRTPSLGFFTKKPFVMGPIGGAELVHPIFFKDLGLASRLKERWRNLSWDRYFFGMLTRWNNNPKSYVFSCNENLVNLRPYLLKKDSCIVHPAIAIELADFKGLQISAPDNPEKPFTMIYAGIAKDWKGLKLFLKSVKLVFANSNLNLSVKLIGIRSEQENKQVNKWIENYGLSHLVQLISFMPRTELMTELQQANLFVYPAFRDSGSMAVLEACILGCPVICFNTGGQDVFPDEILLKVDISDASYEENLKRFSEKLTWAYENEQELIKIGTAAREYVFENFSWDSKVAYFNQLYHQLMYKPLAN